MGLSLWTLYTLEMENGEGADWSSRRRAKNLEYNLDSFFFFFLFNAFGGLNPLCLSSTLGPHL